MGPWEDFLEEMRWVQSEDEQEGPCIGIGWVGESSSWRKEMGNEVSRRGPYIW